MLRNKQNTRISCMEVPKSTVMFCFSNLSNDTSNQLLHYFLKVTSKQANNSMLVSLHFKYITINFALQPRELAMNIRVSRCVYALPIMKPNFSCIRSSIIVIEPNTIHVDIMLYYTLDRLYHINRCKRYLLLSYTLQRLKVERH